MKRIIVLIVLVIMICCSAVVLCGCERELDSKEEYYIYEGKEVAAAMESYDMENIDFAEAMSPDGILPGRELSTKRGISIGSTAKDISRKYKGVAVMVTDTEVKYYEDFKAYLEQKSADNLMCVVIIAGRIEGDAVVNITSEEECDYAKEAMYLVFHINGGQVYNINTIYYNEVG